MYLFNESNYLGNLLSSQQRNNHGRYLPAGYQIGLWSTGLPGYQPTSLTFCHVSDMKPPLMEREDETEQEDIKVPHEELHFIDDAPDETYEASSSAVDPIAEDLPTAGDASPAAGHVEGEAAVNEAAAGSSLVEPVVAEPAIYAIPVLAESVSTMAERVPVDKTAAEMTATKPVPAVTEIVPSAADEGSAEPMDVDNASVVGGDDVMEVN